MCLEILHFVFVGSIVPAYSRAGTDFPISFLAPIALIGFRLRLETVRRSGGEVYLVGSQIEKFKNFAGVPRRGGKLETGRLGLRVFNITR